MIELDCVWTKLFKKALVAFLLSKQTIDNASFSTNNLEWTTKLAMLCSSFDINDNDNKKKESDGSWNFSIDNRQMSSNKLDWVVEYA